MLSKNHLNISSFVVILAIVFALWFLLSILNQLFVFFYWSWEYMEFYYIQFVLDWENNCIKLYFFLKVGKMGIWSRHKMFMLYLL